MSPQITFNSKHSVKLYVIPACHTHFSCTIAGDECMVIELSNMTFPEKKLHHIVRNEKCTQSETYGNLSINKTAP
jgi:hypothetical protein